MNQNAIYEQRIILVIGEAVVRRGEMDRFAGIFQYAYFVEDLEQSGGHFVKRWELAFHRLIYKTDRFEYRGKPVEADVSAFAYAGHCQIQLIQQHDHRHRSIATCLMRANSDCLLRGLKRIMRVPSRY